MARRVSLRAPAQLWSHRARAQAARSRTARREPPPAPAHATVVPGSRAARRAFVVIAAARRCLGWSPSPACCWRRVLRRPVRRSLFRHETRGVTRRVARVSPRFGHGQHAMTRCIVRSACELFDFRVGAPSRSLRSSLWRPAASGARRRAAASRRALRPNKVVRSIKSGSKTKAAPCTARAVAAKTPNTCANHLRAWVTAVSVASSGA